MKSEPSTVKLGTLSEGDKFKFTFSNAVLVVQHKLISTTGGIGVLLVSDGGVYHPDSDVVPVEEHEIVNQEKIKLAAQKWAIDTKKKFPHLSETEFIAGAEWALGQIDSLCNDGANLIEQLKLENDKLKKVIEVAHRYAILEYGQSASCRVIASEIQKALLFG